MSGAGQTTNLAIVDVETTGLSPRLHDAWQAAVLCAELSTSDHGVSVVKTDEASWLFPPPDLDYAEPAALAVSGFYEARQGIGEWTDPAEVARAIARMTTGRQLCGANVVFDRDFLTKLLRRHHTPPAWNDRRLWDIENYVAGVGCLPFIPSLSECAEILGVDPDAYDRHTAIGDVRLVFDLLFPALTGRTAS